MNTHIKKKNVSVSSDQEAEESENENEAKAETEITDWATRQKAEAVLIITNAIKRLREKEHKSTYEEIKLRNLVRSLTIMEGHYFCPRDNRELFNDELFSCMFCDFGHIMECHHPYTCKSLLFNKYARFDSQNQQKLRFLIRTMKGTLFDNEPSLKQIVELLEDAYAHEFYNNEIDEFYHFFTDPDTFQEIMDECISLEPPISKEKTIQ
ncbi:MAG: hypothetical protein BAJALOKI1v1_40013 [Promethearchaeota archaeon]|nr:MAG: hypothetical protein BAJALOKI1v1_40013 [Candidatus Lokiarchaeota archaeon]